MNNSETAATFDEIPGIALAHTPSTRQHLFIRYFIATLVDLIVLNLFAQFWDRVYIEAFSYSLLAAVLLQLLLKLTLKIEHMVAVYYKSRQGLLFSFLRKLSAWLILFVSKFVMLYVLQISVGDAVQFTGGYHGIGTFIAVVVCMLVAEEALVRFYRKIK